MVRLIDRKLADLLHGLTERARATETIQRCPEVRIAVSRKGFDRPEHF